MLRERSVSYILGKLHGPEKPPPFPPPVPPSEPPHGCLPRQSCGGVGLEAWVRATCSGGLLLQL